MDLTIYICPAIPKWLSVGVIGAGGVVGVSIPVPVPVITITVIVIVIVIVVVVVVACITL